jgi:AbiTii-like protein
MSLLRDIQDAAISSNVDISTVLRKCKVLAVRLGNKNFQKWVDEELNGYSDVKELPEYRIFNVHSKGHFAGPFGSGLNNADIPLLCIPEQYREDFGKSYCMDAISVYESLIKTSKGDNLYEQWPPDFVALYGKNIYRGMNCLSAFKVIPHSAFVGLVDAVRNRILNFALEIESEAPDAGEAPINKPLLSQDKVTQVFNTTIYGNVGNIAEGSTNVIQTATLHVNKNDLESLRSQLLNLEVPTSEITALEMALNDDDKNVVMKEKSLGKKVTSWIGNLIIKSVKGSIPVIKELSINLITKAIFMYYGIES